MSISVLLYICLASILCLFCYDLPGSLESQIEHIFNVSSYEFEYLYSMYCIPNIVLAYGSGILIDRVLGVIMSGVLVTVIALISQILFTVGGFLNLYWLLLLARFIYGIGGDSILVVLNYYSVLWFRGRHLNLIFGLGMSMSRLGSAVVFLVSNHVYAWSQQHLKSKTLMLGFSFSTSIASSMLLLGCILTLGWETKRNNKKIERDEPDESSKSNNEDNTFKFIQLRFPLKFWLISIIFLSIQACILVFDTCLQKLLMLNYGIKWKESGRSGSVFNSLLALSGPIAGLFVDKTGRALLSITTSIVLSILSQILILSTSINHFIPMIVFGISAGAMYSCVLPLVDRIVPATQLGMAYGICISLSNLYLTLINIVAGSLLDRYGPTATIILYIAILSVALVSSIVLWTLEGKGGVRLNSHPYSDLLFSRTPMQSDERGVSTKESNFI